jgi:hypothetical protein
LLFRRDLSAKDAGPVTAKVRVTGLPRNLLRLPLRVYTLTPETRGIREAWEAAGKPIPAPRELGLKFVGDASLAPVVDEPGVQIAAGEMTTTVALPPNSVALVTLGSEPSFSVAVSSRGERVQRAEQEYSQAAELLRRRLPSAAVDALRKIQERFADTYWSEVALQTLVGVYEVDMRSPVQAEAVRRELLALPIDGTMRLNLLSRLRVDAVRKGDSAELARVTSELSALEARLTALRNWPLSRYKGE